MGRKITVFILAAILVGVTTSGVAALDPAVTELVSVSGTGGGANGDSNWSSISGDGRYVAFQSYAGNLVANDNNGGSDIFVRDRVAGTTERVSVSNSGAEATGHSFWPSISPDGRYVAFQSYAANLVPGDTNGRADIFVRDRVAGTTERVSVPGDGTQADGDSNSPVLSADGRYVAFVSLARNLVANDTNERPDVFLHDRQTHTTERVSVSGGGQEGNGPSDRAALSADGRLVAFQSLATNLVAGDKNGSADVFVRDRAAGTTELISVAGDGTAGNSLSQWPSLSADGRYVAFHSYAANLVPGDTNVAYDVFVRDRQARTTERVSLADGGAQANGPSDRPSLSADGRLVAFQSQAANLVAGDTNGKWDVFVRDRTTGRTERASVSGGGSEGNGDSNWPALSAGGRHVSFYSFATNLAPGDNRTTYDVFVRDRGNGDTVPPITVAALSGTAGTYGWYTSEVVVTLAATDEVGSGVKEVSYSATGAQPMGSTTASGAGVALRITAEGETTITFYAKDQAGNVEVPKTVVVKLDRTAPTISIRAPGSGPYLQNQAVPADYAVADGISGVANSAGTVPGGGNVDTSAPGTKTFTVSATDNAGNRSTRTVTYEVGYGVRVLHDQTKAANGGSVLPIKLQLVDAHGANVSASGVPVIAQGVVPGDLPKDAGNANPDNSFRYDATLGTAGGYIYNLSTKGLEPGVHSLSFTVGGDPVPHAVEFQVK